MKILNVVSSYWPAFKMGGPIQSIHLMNRRLAAKGIDISVFTTNAGLEADKKAKIGVEEKIDGVKVFRFPYYGYINYAFSPALFWKLNKEIKNFDVIHIAEIWNFASFAVFFWAMIYKKPYIVSPRGSLMAEPLRRKSSIKKRICLFLYVKKFLENAAVIHFTVDMEKEEYIAAGLPLKNFAIIPNGVDFEEFKENVPQGIFRKKWNIPKNKKIILFFGRLNWKKGLDTLIPAFGQVLKKEKNAFLVLEGAADSGYKEKIDRMIKDQNINDNILFTGEFPGKDIAALKDSDVFVLPSYSENFGIAVIHAMYFALPVIITKYVGIAPKIAESGAGIVIEKNEKELAGAILEILGNSSMAEKMGKQGKELALREFSVPVVADRFAELYNDIYERRIL